MHIRFSSAVSIQHVAAQNRPYLASAIAARCSLSILCHYSMLPGMYCFSWLHLPSIWLNIHIKCGNFSLKDFKSLGGYVMIWCWSQLLPWDWQPDCLFHISKRKSCPSDDGLLTTMQTVLKQQNVPTCQELVVVTSSHSQNWSPFSGLFSWRILQYLPKSMWTLGIFGQSYSNLLKSQSCSVRWYFRRIFFQLCCTGCVVFLSVST